jgi:hypothetical protein
MVSFARDLNDNKVLAKVKQSTSPSKRNIKDLVTPEIAIAIIRGPCPWIPDGFVA